MVVDMNHNTLIFSRNRTAAEIWNHVILDSRQSKDMKSTDASNRTEEKLDGRKNNRGFAMRHNCSYRKNVEFVDEVIQEINEGSVATATDYYHDINKCVPTEVEIPRNRI